MNIMTEPAKAPNALNINITGTALARALDLLDGEFAEEETKAVRVYLKGGGCSGFTYEFSLEKEIADDDHLIESRGSIFVIDSVSAAYLEGSTIDYTRSIAGERFVISNPNMTVSCGCGKSFGLA